MYIVIYSGTYYRGVCVTGVEAIDYNWLNLIRYNANAESEVTAVKCTCPCIGNIWKEALVIAEMSSVAPILAPIITYPN